ncbi:retrotransposon protein, putative, ty1-copia subclass [Tanacetum coccineum]
MACLRERNYTSLDMVRSMMNLTTLPLAFLDYALESAIRILNMVPTKKEGSKRSRRVSNRLCLNVKAEEHSLGDLNEPTSYKPAMLDPESNKWLDVMNAKIQSMIDNMVWVLVDLPSNSSLVAKGYTQLYGVDYKETFSLVTDIRAIRILISIAAFYDFEIWQMDVKTAFLNGYLGEDIYMLQPEGFVDHNHPRKAQWTGKKLQAKYYCNVFVQKLNYIDAFGSSAPHFANEPRVQRGARHYHRRYHYVRKSIALEEIRFLKVHKDDNLADPFTKALSKGKVTQHTRSMGLRLASSFM